MSTARTDAGPTTAHREAVDRSSAHGAVRSPGGAGPATRLLALQHAAGNRAVARALADGGPPAQRDWTRAVPSRGRPAARWTDAQIATIRSAMQTLAQAEPTDVAKIADAWFAKSKDKPTEKVDLKGGFKGAGAASAAGGAAAYANKKLGKIDLGALGQAYETLGQVGVLAGGELAAEGELERALPKGLVAKAKGSIKAFGGAYARAEGSGYVRKGAHWWQHEAGASGSAETMAGVKGKGAASTELTATELRGLTGKAGTSGEAMAGADAKARGGVHAGATGVGASGGASGMAGVKAKGDGNVSVELKDLAGVGAELGVEGDAMAGAELDANGELAISKSHVALGGQVKAFAGAKATASAKASGKLYGRKALSAKSSWTIAAGAGENFVAKFSVRRGVVDFDFGGLTALEVGGGAKFLGSVDFKPLSVFVWRQATNGAWHARARASGSPRRKLADPSTIERPLRADLRKYRNFKRLQIDQGKADNYVKVEKVQAYIDTHLPRGLMKKHRQASTIDSLVQRVVEDELGVAPDLVADAEVRRGKVTDLTFVPEDPLEVLAPGARGKRSGTNLVGIGAY